MSEYVPFTLYRSPNLDLAMAKAVLSGLGLKTRELRKEFISTYGYVDLLTFFRERVHDSVNAKAYANVAKEIKKHGKVQVSFGVADELVKDIKEFLAVRRNKLPDRLKDVAKELGSTYSDAVKGVTKNSVEALNDLDKGAGRTAHGLWNAMTAPAGSETVRQGLNDVGEGLYQFGSGIFKSNIQTPLDALLTIIGGEIDARQTVLGIEDIGRSLNAVEEQILRSVFGSSVLLEAIHIKKGNGFYRLGQDINAQNETTYIHNTRALTRGNTIYMKDQPVGSFGWNSTLVHETTHVWQNQNGGTDYMGEALWAQATAGYGYEKDIVPPHNPNELKSWKQKTWSMLNPEQQGQLIQDAYEAGFFTTNKGQWIEVDPATKKVIGPRPDLANFMQGVLPQLLAGQGAT